LISHGLAQMIDNIKAQSSKIKGLNTKKQRNKGAQRVNKKGVSESRSRNGAVFCFCSKEAKEQREINIYATSVRMVV
jgi:hypothetical protein